MFNVFFFVFVCSFYPLRHAQLSLGRAHVRFVQEPMSAEGGHLPTRTRKRTNRTIVGARWFARAAGTCSDRGRGSPRGRSAASRVNQPPPWDDGGTNGVHLRHVRSIVFICPLRFVLSMYSSRTSCERKRQFTY